MEFGEVRHICKFINCGKPTIKCVKGYTNEDGAIIEEYCEEHEKEVHS